MNKWELPQNAVHHLVHMRNGLKSMGMLLKPYHLIAAGFEDFE
jgi:hypothetical protein